MTKERKELTEKKERKKNTDWNERKKDPKKGWNRTKYNNKIVYWKNIKGSQRKNIIFKK